MNSAEDGANFGGHEPKSLTPREREVLGYLLERKRDKEIATALGLSLRTIEKHIERLRQKFGARSRREIRQRIHFGSDSEKSQNT